MRRYLKGVASIRIFLPYLLRLGQTKWNVMGGSLDLLEDLSEVLMEPGGIRMGPTEGTHSATPKLWHSSSHETARGGVLFFFCWFGQWLVGIVVQRLSARSPTPVSIFSVCACVSPIRPELNLKSLQEWAVRLITL